MNINDLIMQIDIIKFSEINSFGFIKSRFEKLSSEINKSKRNIRKH